jgi:hypothetical protein
MTTGNEPATACSIVPQPTTLPCSPTGVGKNHLVFGIGGNRLMTFLCVLLELGLIVSSPYRNAVGVIAVLQRAPIILVRSFVRTYEATRVPVDGFV